MFTGIITNLATVEELKFDENRDLLLILRLKDEVERDFAIGCSIACNGICLTLIKKEGELLYFQASKETCEVTNLAKWGVGDVVNIEFALRLGDEFGGHIVSGHVDGVSELLAIEAIEGSHSLRFSSSSGFGIAKKGSICLNGVSLTINAVGKGWFEVNIIEHTWKNTNLGILQVGNGVNFEIDVVARYVLGQGS